ncbi:MAG: putative Ig domain-containing protein [Planctomycetota bacterium]
MGPICSAATLTINATNGSVIAKPDKADYSVGEVVELTPRPATGYYFAGWAGDARGNRLVLNLTMDGNKTVTANFDPWQPPIGVPVPPFGVTTTHMMYANPSYTYDYGSGPEPYRIGPDGPYTHYIYPGHPSATDTNNPFGTHDRPRLTAPNNMSGRPIYGEPLPPGTVLEFHGVVQLGIGAMSISGTAGSPIFVRGVEGDEPTIGDTLVINGDYILVENIGFDLGTSTRKAVNIGLYEGARTHIAIRNCEFYNGASNPMSSFQVIRIRHRFDSSEQLKNIVIYNNHFHNIGDGRTTAVKTDVVGVSVDTNAEDVWIIDNYMHHIGGDGVQIAYDSWSANSIVPNHIYVGRNTFHDNYENAVDLKDCEHVIVSQNTAYNFGDDYSSYSGPTAIAFRYGPGEGPPGDTDKSWVWTLFNTVYNSSVGDGAFYLASTGGSKNPDDIYYIGNLIHSCHDADKAIATGMVLVNVNRAYLFNNLVYGCDSGMQLIGDVEGDLQEDKITFINNIISEIRGTIVTVGGTSGSLARHVLANNIYNGNGTDGHYKVFTYDPTKTLDIATYETYSAFRNAHPDYVTDSAEVDPQHIDPANEDFHLQPTSPAGGAGMSSGVVQQAFDTFQSLYGIDIRKDMEGTPLTEPWDIGPFKSGNRPPVLDPIHDKRVGVGVHLSFYVSATDVDGDAITYSATGLPTGATFSGQTFNWTPASGQTGTYNITFIASDGSAQDSETVTVTVSLTGNQVPVLSLIGNKSVNENTLLTVAVSATDGDGDPLTYFAGGLPDGARFFGQTFSWTPTYTQAGTYNVTFVVSDGTAQDSETVAITVNNINQLPVLAAIGSRSVNEGSRLSFSVSATDADGDALTYAATGLPSGATFSGRTFTWTPGYTQAGTYSANFIVSDGANQDSETVTITVNNVNREPQLAWIGNRAAYSGSTLSFTISAVDPDNDPIVYSATGLPSGATLTGRYFTWTPRPDQEGSHRVTFIASDGMAQDSETITIAVDDTSPPYISNLTPGDGSIQAPVNSLIILHVADTGIGVDAARVTIILNDVIIYAGNTSDYDSAIGNCRRIGTPADYTYSYQADQPFEFDEFKTVTVDAQDLLGHAMARQSYSFRTEMRSFGQNKKVSSGLDNLNCSSPATACDGNGNIWAVWHAGPVGGRDIYVGKLAAGADSFGASIRVTSDSADQAYPAIAVGTDNRLYVAWQDNRHGDWDICGSTSASGTSWAAASRIVDSNDNDNQIKPALAVDGRSPNRVYVVWQEGPSDNQDIYIATSSNAFFTNTVEQITADLRHQTDPAIAVDSSDMVYVLWTDARNATNGTDIYGAAGSPWTNLAVLTSAARAADQSHPAIAVGSSGSTLHILWVDQSLGDRNIYYASSNGLANSSLTGANLVDDASDADQLTPTIAAVGTGGGLEVFAGWQDERNASGGGDTDLYFVQARSGSGTNVFVGDDGTNSDQGELAAGVDMHGYPYFVWTDYRGANAGIYFAGSTHMESAALESGLISASSGGTIGTAGVQNITDTEDVSITVPAGACPYDVTIAITGIANPHEYALPILGGYEFSPSGLEFDSPVTITIPYAVSSLPGVPTAYWYDSLTGTLSQQGISNIQIIELNSSLHALRFTTTHLTPYHVLLGAESAGGGISGAGGGGGGGGCSLSHSQEAGILEYFLPYGGLALFMLILRCRDRKQKKGTTKRLSHAS